MWDGWPWFNKSCYQHTSSYKVSHVNISCLTQWMERLISCQKGSSEKVQTYTTVMTSVPFFENVTTDKACGRTYSWVINRVSRINTGMGIMHFIRMGNIQDFVLLNDSGAQADKSHFRQSFRCTTQKGLSSATSWVGELLADKKTIRFCLENSHFPDFHPSCQPAKDQDISLDHCFSIKSYVIRIVTLPHTSQLCPEGEG